MKLSLCMSPTPKGVSYSVCSPQELSASQHADLNRDLQATLAFQAAVELERNIPFHIYELESAVLLALPVEGGVQ